MKIHKVITSISLFVMTAILLVGCGKEGEEEPSVKEPSILGKWDYQAAGVVYEFKRDKTLTIQKNGIVDKSGTWYIGMGAKGKNLSISVPDGNPLSRLALVLNMTDEILVLKKHDNGEEAKLIRVD